MTLLGHQNKTHTECKNFFRKTGIGWFEIDGILEEIGKIEYSPYTLCDKIYAIKTDDELLTFYKNCTDAYVKALERKGQKEVEKINSDAKEKADREKKFQEDLKKSKEEKSKKEERFNDDLQKPVPADNPSSPPPKFKDDFDEEKKKEYISDVEFYLKTNKVSDEKLNQRLQVSDWKEEINKTVNWNQSMDRKYDLRKIIDELAQGFVCAKCGQPDSSRFPYKKGGKKYCSYECQKNDGKIEVSDIGKIVKAFQDWMKKNKIEKISYSAKGELIIQFAGQTAKAVEDSQLSTEQKEVKNFLKANPQTSEISVEKGYEYNPSGPNKKGGNAFSNMTGKEVTLGGLVIVAIIAVIITLIVRATRRNKD